MVYKQFVSLDQVFLLRHGYRQVCQIPIKVEDFIYSLEITSQADDRYVRQVMMRVRPLYKQQGTLIRVIKAIQYLY
jgi:hypothetical protein